MKLSTFIQQNWETGKVEVAYEFEKVFSSEDLEETAKLLQEYYQQDLLNKAFDAPDFSIEAARWSAQYFYFVIQCICVRSIEKEKVLEVLHDFKGEKNASSIYTIDLLFRQLPHLLKLAKGFSPEDVLVECLQKQLENWILSSVGEKVEIIESQEQIILNHPFLKMIYIERIINEKDQDRITDQIEPLILEALGNYQEHFWKNLVHGK